MDTKALARMQIRLAPDAKTVTLGSQVTYGLLDDDEQLATDEAGQPVTVRTRQVTVVAGTLTGVQDGATVVFGGATFTVRGRPMPRENGDLWTFRVVA